jgi:hypothetical protein
MFTPFVVYLAIANALAASGVSLAAWHVAAYGTALPRNSVGIGKSEEIAANATNLDVEQSHLPLAA